MRLFFPLSGDDVFISYSRKDGALYAAGLADKLTEKNLSCFIDKLGTEPNHDLPPSLRKKIRNCTVFVLIGTEKAAQSSFVEKEIVEFKQTGRIILPIDFDGNVGKAIWYEQIPGLATETEKDLHTLETGNPSQNVVSFIEKSFNYTRRNQYTFRMFLGAIILFFILAGSGIGSYLFARNQANIAKQEAETQTEKARAATKKADEETEKANKAESRAKEQEEIARVKELEANAATEKAAKATGLADKMNKLAQQKTKLAQEKTKLAEEKTKLANAETQRANAAATKAEQAETKFTQSQNNLAENYYNISQTSALSEAIQALPWAQKAIETAPNENIYKLWALNLTGRIPKFIINPLAGIGREIIYSPANDKAVTVSRSNQLTVWNLKSGEQIPNPLINCSCKIVDVMLDDPTDKRRKISRGNPIFSPDGKFIAALTAEFSSAGDNSDRNVYLHIWNAETGKELFNKQDARFREREVEYFVFSPNGKEILINNSTQGYADRAEILHWDIESGREQNPIYTGVLNMNGDNTYWFDKTFPLSRIPERNWILIFEESETGRFAVVKDISTGEQIGNKMPLPKAIESINFSGAAGRIVTVFLDENNKRMISAFDIEKGTSTEPVRFAVCFPEKECKSAQEFKILDFSRDDNRILADCGDINVSIWGLSERRRINQYELWTSKTNLNAFFSNDEKFIITVADSFNSAPTNPKQEVSIINAANGLSKKYYPNLNGKVRVSTSADTFYRNVGSIILIDDFDKNIKKDTEETDVKKLPINNEDCLFKMHKTPDGSAILGFYYHPCLSEINRNSQVSVKMQLWDLSTRLPKWNSEGITLGTAWGLGGIENLLEAVFDSTGKRFVTVSQEYYSYPKNFKPNNTLMLWETDSGKPSEGYQAVEGNIQGASFSKDDSNLITVESIDGRRWRIQSRNSITGETNNSAVEFDKKENGEYKALVNRGNYIITVPAAEDFINDFNMIRIYNVDSGQKTYQEFNFRDYATAALAIEVLKKANNIKPQDDNSLKIEFNSKSFIVITESGKLSLTSGSGITSQVLAPEFNPGFESIGISSDGRLFLKSNSSSMGLWDSKTRLPIIENIGFPGMFYELSQSNEGILTIFPNGEIHNRKITSGSSETIAWLSGMSEALSGMRIVNEVSRDSIEQDEYLRLRKSYLERLKIAAGQNSVEAQFILNNWKP